MPSVRQIAQELLNRVLNNPTMPPGMAAQISNELSVLLGTIGEHVADLEWKAYGVMKLALEKEEDVSVARAELEMKASKEWLEYRKARALLNACEQTIISLRRKASSEEREYNLTSSNV